MSTRILVVDDEQFYRHLLTVNLETEGYEVIAANHGEQALEMVSSRNPDLVILDVAMPRLDGFETCERIRQFSDVPVIMLTARGEEQDRADGVNGGAGESVRKPFSATELVARVRAVLRRAKSTQQIIHKRYFTHLNLRIDFARAEVWRGEHPVYLSATEYRLLIQFAQHAGRILPAEELLTAVWGESYREDKEILWVSIARLRQKLEDDPHNPQHIVTRSGLGYMMPSTDTTNLDEKGS